MVRFWNGNKSPIRQAYEKDLITLILQKTRNATSELWVDDTDYPSAEDEGNIFQRNIDTLVTVAGNKKFTGRSFLRLDQPLSKGLLGHRILIIRKTDQPIFKDIDETTLKCLTMGIPATWADADLFRFNQYSVFEQGGLETMVSALEGGQCDYLAFGANEVTSIFQQYCDTSNALMIEPSLVLYYPFPLVFYVHPDKGALLKRLAEGFDAVVKSTEFDQLFGRHYSAVTDPLRLETRHRIDLINPSLPAAFGGFQSNFVF